MIRSKKVDFSKVYSNLDELKNVFSQYKDKIVVAYLFGSVHRRQVTPLSDVDIAILINKDYEDIINEIEEKLYEDLVRCLKTDEIDLVCLNRAPLSVQYGVIKDKEILYFSDKQKVVDYETSVITNYLDIKSIRDFLNLEFLKKVGI
ncbi:MAG: nucleotidyltransferase domain protein [Caloramator sp.]|jgi:predicted nucleotidyltransferase|uniref:type VII toxin-antitoxin system MntA family adenylyltransferase antitoxin n=1 Tax=Caloramator sp. TaxID=1871330 RepID=UPI001D88CA59|nr:nucleotidyltransferase domain-containing protein [Caloramator sp.]MBZ4662594.1 nucleotidyltransferase domain protein [Caloramator sp.]